MAAATGTRATTARAERTPAQWYCLLAGAALLLAGIVGFIADSTFGTGSNVDGDNLVGIFEVNGWHNVVHALSGIVLLGASGRRASAKAVAIGFGVVYGLVAIYGLIDGSDVIGLIPVNGPDNALHVALALAGILAGVASPATDRLRTSTADSQGRPGTNRAEDTRFDRDESIDPLTGRPFTEKARTLTNR